MADSNSRTGQSRAEGQSLRAQKQIDEFWDFLSRYNRVLSHRNRKTREALQAATFTLPILQEALRQADSESRSLSSIIMRARKDAFPVWFDVQLRKLEGTQDGESAEWREKFPYLYQPPNPTVARIGPYRVLSLLGHGAMGTVFKARRTDAGRPGHPLAIKAVDSKAPIPARKRRFEREAVAMSELNNHHIVQFKEYLMYGGDSYLVMQYVYGPTLDELMGYHRPRGLPTPLVVDLIRQVALGLKYIQLVSDGKLIHRDLKPGNLLLERADTNIATPHGWQLRIADFGLAVNVQEKPITKENQRPGTLGYMAPEQYLVGDRSPTARKLTPLTDVYALGVIAHEMLSGQTFRRDLWARSAPDKRAAPALQGFGAFIGRMVEFRPENRPSARDIVDEMTGILERLGRTELQPAHTARDAKLAAESVPTGPATRPLSTTIFTLPCEADRALADYFCESLQQYSGISRWDHGNRRWAGRDLLNEIAKADTSSHHVIIFWSQNALRQYRSTTGNASATGVGFDLRTAIQALRNKPHQAILVQLDDTVWPADLKGIRVARAVGTKGALLVPGSEASGALWRAVVETVGAIRGVVPRFPSMEVLRDAKGAPVEEKGHRYLAHTWIGGWGGGRKGKDYVLCHEIAENGVLGSKVPAAVYEGGSVGYKFSFPDHVESGFWSAALALGSSANRWQIVDLSAYTELYFNAKADYIGAPLCISVTDNTQTEATPSGRNETSNALFRLRTVWAPDPGCIVKLDDLVWSEYAFPKLKGYSQNTAPVDRTKVLQIVVNSQLSNFKPGSRSRTANRHWCGLKPGPRCIELRDMVIL